MRLLPVVSLSLILAGCGLAGGNSANPSQATMQIGQWEFTVASTNGDPNLYVEADVTNGNGTTGYGSYINATAMFWPQNGGPIAGAYDYCSGFQTTYSMTGQTVTALLFAGSTQVTTATATLAADGKSMSGTFQMTGASAFCAAPVSATGTFTGQLIAPINGTYKGTLSDGSLLSIQITEDSAFNITANGTSVNQGVTTTITIGPNTASNSLNDVIGAAVGTGRGTATNVNGTQSFSVFGHFTPDASQISFVANNGTWTTGTLTKQ